jgi:hypothetical protein
MLSRPLPAFGSIQLLDGPVVCVALVPYADGIEKPIVLVDLVGTHRPQVYVEWSLLPTHEAYRP